MEHVGDRRLTDRSFTLRDCCCCSCGLGLLFFFFSPTFLHLFHCLPLPLFPLLAVFLVSSHCCFLLSGSRHLDAVIFFCDLQHLPHHLFTLFFFHLNPEHLVFSAPSFPFTCATRPSITSAAAMVYSERRGRIATAPHFCQDHGVRSVQQWRHAEFSEVYSWTVRHVLAVLLECPLVSWTSWCP